MKMKMSLFFFFPSLNVIFKAVKQGKGQGIYGWRSLQQPCRGTTISGLDVTFTPQKHLCRSVEASPEANFHLEEH